MSEQKYTTDRRGLTIAFVTLAVVVAASSYFQRNPSIELSKIIIGIAAWSAFVGFGILLMTVYSYAAISGTTLKFVYLLLQRRTIDINSIIEINDQPTYKVAKSQFRSLYIFYKDKDDKIKWIEFRVTIFPEKTLGRLIKDLKEINPKIEINDYAEKLMLKTSK